MSVSIVPSLSIAMNDMNQSNNNNNNNNFDLPPIRKIGPAVLPKPKNIKIHAGRVLRYDSDEAWSSNQEETSSRQFARSFQTSSSSTRPINPANNYFNSNAALKNNLFLSNSSLDNFSEKYRIKSNESQQQEDQATSPSVSPFKAKLVQIPVEIVSSSLSSSTPSQSKSATTSPILARKNLSSQSGNIEQSNFFFPTFAKNTAEFSIEPPFHKYEDRNESSESIKKNQIPQPPPFPSSFFGPTTNKPPTSFQPSRHDLVKLRNQQPKTTINFSSDGTSSSPTITITTGRGPNSPTITTSAQSPSANSSPNSFTYNIPVQYIQQQAQQQLQQQQQLNSNYQQQQSPNSNYVIPVTMKLMNNGNNGLSQSPTSTSSGRAGVRTYSSGSPPPQNHFASNASPPMSPLLSPGANSNFSSGGNIIIRANNSPVRTRREDEVDLLKDLLIKNMKNNNTGNMQLETNSAAGLYGICMRCNERVLGPMDGMRAMDQLFHVACFSCFACGMSLQSQEFYAMDGNAYCENCYMDQLERCSSCHKPITDRILRAAGKTFHPECFSCVVCKKTLDGVPFTVDASNKIHCIECFHEKYAPRCYICHKPITPEPGVEETVRIVAMDRNFHINCYKCEDCGVSLSSNAENAGGCFPLDDHIYCKSCNMQRAQRGNQFNANGAQISSNNYGSLSSLANKFNQSQSLHYANNNNNISNNNSYSPNLTPRSTDL